MDYQEKCNYKISMKKMKMALVSSKKLTTIEIFSIIVAWFNGNKDIIWINQEIVLGEPI